MPTGYTSAILEGATFEEYALQCARNFGALVMMRDEPIDKAIPDKFEPSSYAKQQLEKAKKEFARLNDLTKIEWQKELDASYKSICETYGRYNKENAEKRAKYEAMLQKAKAYKAPTPEHENYGNFLVSQIEDSIKFDCSHIYEIPVKLTLDEFVSDKLAQVQKDIAYFNKSNAEELERTDKRNQWIADLRKSLNI